MLRSLVVLLLIGCGVEGEYDGDDVFDDLPGFHHDDIDGVYVPVWSIEDDGSDVQQTDDNWPSDWISLEEQVFALVNEERAKGANCGSEGRFDPAPPLSLDTELRAAARGHSEDMGQKNYFSHDSKDGRDFMDRIEDAGYSGGGPWGENIAAGYGSPAEVIAGWMSSDGHCSNIMSAEYNEIGVGYAYEASSSYGHYWTQNFGRG